MSNRGGRPALDLLGQELRRGAEDYGLLDGTELVAVFSHPDAPGRPREGRKSILDVGFGSGGGGGGASFPEAEALFMVVNWLPVTVSNLAQFRTPGIVFDGVLPGARLQVSTSFDLQGCFAHGHVTIADNVYCYVANLTGADKALAGGTLFVTAWNTDPQHPPGSEGHLLLESGDRIRLE